MKNVIVAITAPNTPLVSMLPPCFYMGMDTTLVYHNSAHTEYNGGVISCNYDYHLDLSVDGNALSKLCIGDRYLHQPRVSKTKQMYEIYRYNHLKENSGRTIKYPEHYNAYQECVGGVSQLGLIGAPKGARVVIKPEFGARGEGQIVLPTHQLYDFLHSASALSNVKIADKFPDVILSPSKYDNTPSYIDVDSIMVSDYIENIAYEYRLIVAGAERYVFPRKIKEGAYPQANLDSSDRKLLPYTRLLECRIDGLDPHHINAFIDHIGMIYGSIDLYITTDGKLGIFEYSNEFGISGMMPSLAKSFIIDATIAMVKKG